MQFFFKNFTHILKRTQLTKFENLFLVKIANKGTSLIIPRDDQSQPPNTEAYSAIFIMKGGV